LTIFPETLASVEPGRKQVLSVEDWAEIRRLRRAEGMAISEIARVLGIARNTVKAALASDGPPQYPAGSGRVSGRCVRAAVPGVAEVLSVDAGDGDRGADRVAVFDPDAEQAGRGAAAGIPAAGPGVADQLCGRGDRPV
jgi:hypothetical protein